MTAPPRLLLVDDERSITDGLAPFLTRSGFDVRVAADGQDAWDQVCTWHPDIVVSDVVMPVFDGRELVRRLREDPVMRYVVENGPGYRPGQPADQGIRDLRWPVACWASPTPTASPGC